MRSLVGLSLLVATLLIAFTASVGADGTSGGATEPNAGGPGPAGSTLDPFRQKLLELTNQYRLAYGRPPLLYNERLGRSAQTYAESMGDLGFFGHEAPGGGTMTSRFEADGYLGWTAIGENLGAGYKKPEDVFQGWLESATHRDNLLNPSYREIGIGYSSKPKSPYGDYWVETYGTRPGKVEGSSSTQPKYVLGFAAFHRAAPQIVGEPLEDVWHLGQGSDSQLALQRTRNGILLWVKPLNQMVFITDERAFGFRDGRVEPLSDAERQVFGAIAGRPAPPSTAAVPSTSEELDQATQP